MASKGKMNGELKWIWKKALWIEVLPGHFPGETEKNQGKLPSG
jgi:hypothetical protein